MEKNKNQPYRARAGWVAWKEMAAKDPLPLNKFFLR